MSQVTTIPINDSKEVLDKLLDQIDSLENKACRNCKQISHCNDLCGDVRIFQEMRQEIQNLPLFHA